MFSAKLKTNARKSTHSGKVRRGTAPLQDGHRQDAPSYSSSLPQHGRSGEKLHSSSANQSKDRTIWDTKFTEPEPIHRESSDDVIWVSTQTAMTPRSLSKHNAKVSVFSPKVASGSDRNIFSALSPSKKTSESKSSHVSAHHGSRTSHQASNASRSLSSHPGRNASDFVFKKPTARPPVSRIQQSVSSVSDRQRVPSSSPTLSKSGDVKHQLGGSKMASGSVPVSARAHAGRKTKTLQRSTSMPGLSQSDEIIPILERREIFTPRRASTGSGGSIGSPQNLELHEKIKMKINIQGLKKLKEIGKLTGRSINSGLALKKSTGKAHSLGIGRSIKSSLLPHHEQRGSIGKIGSTGLRESDSCSLKAGQVKRKTNVGSKNVGNLERRRDFEHFGKFQGLGESSGFGDLGGFGDFGELNAFGPRGGFDDLGGMGELGGLGEMHGGRDFGESSSMMLNDGQRSSLSKGSFRTTLSSTKSKPQKAGKPVSGLTAFSRHGATSPNPHMKTMDKISSRPVKSILTKSTSKKSGAREPSVQATRSKPPVNHSSVSQIHPVIDLCKPATSRKSVSTRFRQPTVIPHHPSIKSQVSARLQSNRVSPSHRRQTSNSTRKVGPINRSSRQPQKKPVKNPPQTSSAHSQSGSKERCPTRDNKATSGSFSTLNQTIVPLERLEVRLSPVNIQCGVPGWDHDEIDGVLFSSFSTQSDLESYLKSHPEETLTHVQQDKGSCNMPTPLRGNNPSHGGNSVCTPNKFKQFEQQLLADLQKSACHEVLHPKLIRRGLSITRDMIRNGIKRINLRAYGIRWKIRTRAGASKSRKRTPLTERKQVKAAEKSKIESPMKNCSATPMTGLKMKFTMRGKEEDRTKVTESTANPEPTSDKSPEPPAAEAESTTTQTSAKKLPIKESIPFKPFEKEVMSSKSAFVSDELDKYLEDVEKHSSALTGPGHPLLQSKASSVTFLMPSKQSSYIKTLDTALKERQMAKYKSKIPTVAETAQKLAKSLKHTSDAFRISDPQSALKEKESPISYVKVSDSNKTPDAVMDTQITRSPPSVQGTKLNSSPKPKRKEVNLDEKKRILEERLESVKKKLKESTAFVKKSPTKVKSQTSWTTKLKIVNSRLVQQLNAPGKNAHLIRSKETSQSTGVKIKTEKDNATQNLSLNSEYKLSPEAKTDKHDGDKKGKSKAPKEFVRLDQQTTCDKVFCRLGCICESINLNLPVERLTKHCRKAECMFECTCQRNSVRILRNRKRPTIFQEKSMLFYDGVGMFSNNNAAFVEEDTSIPQDWEKPKVLFCVTSCARTTLYKPKSKYPPKEPKAGYPSSLSGNPQKKPELQRPNVTTNDAAQPQSLPKEVPSASQVALKTPPSTAKQEIADLEKGQQPSVSKTGRTISPIPKAGDVVPSVLYAPVQVSLSNQQGMVLLYAPVNTLPYMVQKIPVSGNQQQISNLAASGSKLAQVPASDPKLAAQVQVGSDPKQGDSKTKPVAATIPTTSTSKPPSTPASVSEDHSELATETEKSCKVCKALKSGELSVVFLDASPTTVSKQHTCSQEARGMMYGPTDREKEKEVCSTTACTDSPTKDGPAAKSSTDDRVISKVLDSCEEQTDTPKVTSSKVGTEALPEVNKMDTVSESQKAEETISAEQTKIPKGDSSAATNFCANDENGSVCDSQTSAQAVSAEQTKTPQRDTETALNQKDDPTSATKVCADDAALSVDPSKSVSTSTVQLKEVSQDAMVEMSDAKEKISAVVTKIKSPVGSPTTSPTARSSTGPINLVRLNRPDKSQSGSVSPDCAIADLNKKLNSAALSLPKAVRINPKSADVSSNKPVKVPAFSYTMEKKGNDEKNPKFSKTQVFLPGSSMSAISSKNANSSGRSPLLIEIQSECNWADTKNDILSTIAKHTSKADGGPGVMRVGKFLVEILSKEEQKHIAVSVDKTTPVSVTKMVEQKALPIKPPVGHTSPNQPACAQQTLLKQTVEMQVPAAGTQLPALKMQMPLLGTQMSALAAQLSALGKQVPALGTPKPTTGDQVPTLGMQVPTSGTQAPSKGNSSIEPKKILVLPSNPVSKQLNLAKAGSITTPMKPGTAPLLTTLPPGSILISDGKSPSAYLVPLKAVQDTLKGSSPPAIQSMTLKQPTIQSTQSLLNAAPGVPKIMPRLGTPGSGKPKDISTSASSSKQLPLAWCHPQNSVKHAAQVTSVPSTTSQIGNIQGKPFASSTSPASLNGVDSSGKTLTEKTAKTKTLTTQNSSMPMHLGQIPSQVVAPPVSKPASLNQQVHLSQTVDPFKPNVSVFTTVGTSQRPPAAAQATVKAPRSTNDSDEFVDVESLDGVHPRSLLYAKRKPPLLKPKPIPIIPIALTSDAPQRQTSGSRRKTEHRVRPTLPIDDQEEEIDVVTYEDKSKGQRKSSLGKTPSRSASSSSKRKRKSPVVQQSVMALEEPEFIESYYEVSSDDENGDGEHKRHKRDKPNKVLHLIKERQRRRDQSDLFGGLKSVLVKEKHSKVSKVALLEKAHKEIKQLELDIFRIEVEETKLKQENFQKRTKLASLLDVNVMDFPSAFTDQKDPDFAEFIKEMKIMSDGVAYGAHSETTSQDSESIDMDSSDDDTDKTDSEKGITRQEYEHIVSLLSQTATESKPSVRSKEFAEDSGDVGLQPQTITADPASATILMTPARHAGLPMTVPTASAFPRVIPKSKPGASPSEHSIGISFPDPVPTALPFDLHMTPSQMSPVQKVNVTPPRTSQVDEVTFPEAVQNVDLLMEVSSESPQPDQGDERAEQIEEPISDSVLSNPMQALPAPSSAETGLTENDLNVTDCVTDAASTFPTEDINSLCNQADRVNGSHGSSEIVDNLELETATSSIEQCSPDMTDCINRNGDSSNLSSTVIVGSANKTVENKTVPQSETSATSQTQGEFTSNLADGPSNIPEGNDCVKSGSEQDSPANENNALNAANQEKSKEDNLIGLQASSKGKNLDTEPSEKSSANASSGNKEATPQQETWRSPKRSTPPNPADSLAASLPPIITANTAVPSSLSVVSIKVKGGVVNVTCSSGEVIPLAVVKASTDGTMQVAVEGDISSEKVEELLSKSEVMECLEKVADDTCEQSDS